MSTHAATARQRPGIQRRTERVYATGVLRRPAFVLVILAAAAGTASADEGDAASRAQAIAADAQGLAQGGDYLGAAARYKEALALDPRPEYECNVGIAFWK